MQAIWLAKISFEEPRSGNTLIAPIGFTTGVSIPRWMASLSERRLHRFVRNRLRVRCPTLFPCVPSYSLSVMSNSRSLILFELRIFTR